LWEHGITAVFNWRNEKAYFFRGSEYIRYDIAADKADPGYPRPIAGNWPGLWADGITAVFNWRNEKAYFFRGSEYIRYDIATDKADPGYPRPIAGDWPGLWADGITAVLNWDNEKAYFFRNTAKDISFPPFGNYRRTLTDYIRYDIAAAKADPGYPRPIAENWPGLLGYGDGITAVLNWGIPEKPTQKQLDYSVLLNSSNRPQMFLDGSFGPARKIFFLGKPIIEKNSGDSKFGVMFAGSLAWLCEDRVPFSAYWNPENDINVVVACSHPRMFPTEVMDGLKKVNNLKMVDHISWLWFY